MSVVWEDQREPDPATVFPAREKPSLTDEQFKIIRAAFQKSLLEIDESLLKFAIDELVGAKEFFIAPSLLNDLPEDEAVKVGINLALEREMPLLIQVGNGCMLVYPEDSPNESLARGHEFLRTVSRHRDLRVFSLAEFSSSSALQDQIEVAYGVPRDEILRYCESGEFNDRFAVLDVSNDNREISALRSRALEAAESVQAPVMFHHSSGLQLVVPELAEHFEVSDFDSVLREGAILLRGDELLSDVQKLLEEDDLKAVVDWLATVERESLGGSARFDDPKRVIELFKGEDLAPVDKQIKLNGRDSYHDCCQIIELLLSVMEDDGIPYGAECWAEEFDELYCVDE